MEKTPTAEEIYLKITGCLLFTNDKPNIKKAMIEFAKLHVEAALKNAGENAETKLIKYTDDYEIDKYSILKSYPLDKIK